jgi:hypothetical protein
MSESDQYQASAAKGADTAAQAVGDKVSDLAETVQDRIAESVGPAAQKATEKAISLAEQQKAAGAQKLKELARSVQGAADGFESELPQVSKSIREAAAAIERASSALKDRSIEDLASSVGEFARSKPVVFFSFAALAGFAAARFLKSADEPRSPRRYS